MHDDDDLQPLAVPIRILAGGVIIRASRAMHAAADGLAMRAEDVARLASRVLPGLDEPEPDHHGDAIERIAFGAGVPLRGLPAMPEDTLDPAELVEVVLDGGTAEGRVLGGMISPLRTAARDVLDVLRMTDDGTLSAADAEAIVQRRAAESHGDVNADDLGAVVRTVRRAIIDSGSRDTPRSGG